MLFTIHSGESSYWSITAWEAAHEILLNSIVEIGSLVLATAAFW
jgi:hypothetical protein